MKFNVPSKVLYNHVSAVSKVINSKNALQILNSLLFTLEGDKLTITASDVENAITAEVPVTGVEGEGSFCLDARRIVDLLKELPAQPLSVHINDSNFEVLISHPDGDYNLVAISGDQFPQYTREATEEQPQTFKYPAADLLTGIENTLFAIGSDDFHPQMMGILFDIKPDCLIFVATDTRKMVRFIDRNAAPGIEARCILPAKPAGILKSILDKEGEAEITMTSKSATFRYGAYTFNCRFIKGGYPDYNRVIPSNNPFQVRVDRLRFLNAVRRVGVFVDPGFGMEKFKITNDKIYLKSADTSMLTAGKEQLDCEYTGPEIVIGFGAPHLIEICNTLTTEQILIDLADQSRPGVFRPTENEGDTELVMLLMPMNAGEF